MVRIAKTGLVALALALLAGSGAAVAGGLIGSRDVANNSLRSLDIRNGTLSAIDVRDGSLTRNDFSDSALAGVRPDRVYTWNVSFTEDGSLGGQVVNPVVTSADTLPARSHVQVVDFEADPADLENCDQGGLWVAARPGASRPADRLLVAEYGRSTDGPGRFTFDLDERQIRAEGPAKLGVYVECYDENFQRIPVPSFSLALTFTVTNLDVSGAVVFD